MPDRLSQASLGSLPPAVATPRYDRTAIGTGIVHIGVGAFHRCHQAVMTEAVMNRFGGNWGICGVSLRSPSVRDALAPQDCLYSVTVRDNDTPGYQVIGAIRQILVASENPRAVIDAIASQDCRLVTLTITEKGYCLNQATGELNTGDSDIQHDLAHLNTPRTAIGYLVAGLIERQRANRGGISLLSCDNLGGNGNKLKQAILSFAREISEPAAQWIDAQCSFPCSVVDRIVPATTDEDRANIQRELGLEDRAAVVTEPFIQWIVEDHFVAGRPEWEQVGARLVSDTAPFEKMKLRLLNGSHSALAYLSCLAGYDTIAATMRDRAFRGLVEELMSRELQPTLGNLEGFDTGAYQQKLIARFANTGLKHLTRQIAMDGSQKIPLRLLPAFEWQLANDQRYTMISLAVAAWIRYTQGIDERGQSYQVDDPMAATFRDLFTRADGNQDRYLQAVLAIDTVFPPALAGNEQLRASIGHWLARLDSHGALKTVHEAWNNASE